MMNCILLLIFPHHFCVVLFMLEAIAGGKSRKRLTKAMIDDSMSDTSDGIVGIHSNKYVKHTYIFIQTTFLQAECPLPSCGLSALYGDLLT